MALSKLNCRGSRRESSNAHVHFSLPSIYSERSSLGMETDLVRRFGPRMEESMLQSFYKQTMRKAVCHWYLVCTILIALGLGRTTVSLSSTHQRSRLCPKNISYFFSSSDGLLILIWRSEYMNLRASPNPRKCVAPSGVSPFAVYVQCLPVVLANKLHA